jgi:hypothetical protein
VIGQELTALHFGLCTPGVLSSWFTHPYRSRIKYKHSCGKLSHEDTESSENSHPAHTNNCSNAIVSPTAETASKLVRSGALLFCPDCMIFAKVGSSPLPMSLESIL